jgi:Ca-activated chloride channel family protein
MPQASAEAMVEAAPTEGFADYGINPVIDARKDRLSTFSIDVDTASYSFARRKLVREHQLPPVPSVRAEEFLNSFDYEYAPPNAGDKAPFKVHFAAAPSPFAAGHHLVSIGVQAKRITPQERVPVHLVYLVDTSGSMSAVDRLPLAQRSLALLTETLKPGDTVALCTYAGDTRVVLEPTGIEQKAKILAGIRGLTSGGGTAMSSGVELAYALASKTLVKGHRNHVVVLSDGDANIGRTSHEELLSTIGRYKDQGITLSTVGFGSGNYKDVMMEQLADKGDGNYTYIDGEDEARKVFSEQVDGLLQIVARDVKIQVEMDPTFILRYRLIGYENRDIADKDFRNDKVDAGEVGAGHSVTALYDVELAPRGNARPSSPLVVRMRHKPAKNALHGGSDEAIETSFPMPMSAIAPSFEEAPENFRFATAVGAFAEVLRKSPYVAGVRLEEVERIAAAASHGRKDRTELVNLVRTAERLSDRSIAIAR